MPSVEIEDQGAGELGAIGESKRRSWLDPAQRPDLAPDPDFDHTLPSVGKPDAEAPDGLTGVFLGRAAFGHDISEPFIGPLQEPLDLWEGVEPGTLLRKRVLLVL